MAKIKTNRGACKRFKRTASGKFKHKQSHLRHILTKKCSQRKRQLRNKKLIASCNVPRVRKLLGQIR